MQSVSSPCLFASVSPVWFLRALALSMQSFWVSVCVSRASCFVSPSSCVSSSVLPPRSHQSDYVHLCSPDVSSLPWLPLVCILSASHPVRCHDLPHPWMSALSDCICAIMSTSSVFIKYLPVGVIKRFKLCCWPCATGGFILIPKPQTCQTYFSCELLYWSARKF